MSLIDQILAVKGDYAAQQAPGGKLFPNVQNLGLPEGCCAVRHKKGAYHQFALRAEQDIPPLLTHLRVAAGVRAMEAGDWEAAAEAFTVTEEFRKQGAGVVHAALCLWLDKNRIPMPAHLRNQALPLPPELQQRLLLRRTDPMPFPLSIAAVGCVHDTGESVVPDEWLGRSFENGDALCQAINTQPHRQGQAEATFCCHYGLKRVHEPKWLQADEIEVDSEPAYGVSLVVDQGVLSTSIVKMTPGQWTAWVGQQPERVRFLTHEFAPPGNDEAGLGRFLLIACDKEAICESLPVLQKTRPVGLLSSIMQKSIRRGRGAARTLAVCMQQLRQAPAYNLPDDHFKRSSGCRQMAWRLFISIFEDAEPYAPSSPGDYLSLGDLVALSLIAHAEPDLQFNEVIANQLIRTALLAQRNDQNGRNWDWRSGKPLLINGDTALESVCAAALDCLPMMKGDAEMLKRGCSHARQNNLPFSGLPAGLSDETLLGASDPNVEQEVLSAAYDFHSQPAILLHLQSSLPWVDDRQICIQPSGSKQFKKVLPTTQHLKRFIWSNVSRLNVRNPQQRPATDEASQALIPEIRAIQKWLLEPQAPPVQERQPYSRRELLCQKHLAVEPHVARTAFISLFGQSVELAAARTGEARRLKHGFVAIVAGTPHEPCKIKKKGAKKDAYLQGKQRAKGELDLVDHLSPTDGLEIAVPPPPTGFQWSFPHQAGKARIRITRREPQPNADEDNVPSGLLFRVNDMEVPAFDASCLLARLPRPVWQQPSPHDADLIKQALYQQPTEHGGQWSINQKLRVLAGQREKSKEPDLSWGDLAANAPVPPVVWQRARSKLLSTFLGRVIIGPVDRSGDKIYAAVDYRFEGTLWRIFNLLSFVHPDCVQPAGDLDFHIRHESPSYSLLVEEIEKLSAPRTDASIPPQAPAITTTLWQHQASSVDRITEELLKNGRKGFGDASDVGSGKTLTSLAIMNRLAEHNLQEGDATAEGFLVLVYNAPLVETWRDEIKKHSTGFHFVTQDSAGTLSAPIGRHSILVTTLARMRDTPVTRRWHMVVIDECLSVQNANALWTQEAWRQVACSQRGVLLLSATLFRARFNELFYMLRMLRTGLPEKHAYLDAILAESITCHLPENTPWHWVEETRRMPLDDETRQKYERTRNATGPAKMIYGRLDALLVESFDFASHVLPMLNQLNEGSRALIFARSAREAAHLARAHDAISLFPDISKRHVVTTTAQAARGVNTLVDLNVLMTRPVEPDLVPQMKGRLARPRQQDSHLRWIWLVIEKTIEEAKLERNRLAEKFHDEHIMPLANFYEHALAM